MLRFSCLTIFTWARLISGCFFGIPCLKCLRSAYIVFSFSKDVRRSSTVFIIPAHYLFLVVVHVYELFVGCGNVTIFFRLTAILNRFGFVYWKWGCRGRPKTGWIIISSHQRINNSSNLPHLELKKHLHERTSYFHCLWCLGDGIKIVILQPHF